MASDVGCALCDPALGPIMHESGHWRLVLNRNQDLLGKCFLALRRHEEAVTALSPDEWQELHAQLRLATGALRLAFRPDHVNYAFLQNQDRHVHLHIVPRYATRREFEGAVFDDPGYPGHYLVGVAPRRLSAGAERLVAGRIRRGLGAGDATLG